MSEEPTQTLLDAKRQLQEAIAERKAAADEFAKQRKIMDDAARRLGRAEYAEAAARRRKNKLELRDFEAGRGATA